MRTAFGITFRAFLLVTLAGCTAPRGPFAISDADPANKIPAIRHASKNTNPADRAQLVADLNSDDPAVRLFSIEALEKITGERLGYQYYFDEEQRAPSIARWKAWLEKDTRP